MKQTLSLISRIGLACSLFGLPALGVLSASATDRYVNVNSADPAPPYTNWATAARVIQDAVDAAQGGDGIIVTNGIYKTGGRIIDGVGSLTNRVAIDKPVMVRSVNGPEVTVIVGREIMSATNEENAVRCVYLADGAVLSGFTLTNGGAYRWDVLGGGVRCEYTATVTNCVLAGNAAWVGGGTYGGALINCTLVGNIALNGGGAAGGTLNNCLLEGNAAHVEGFHIGPAGAGGGAFQGVLNGCTLIGNTAGIGGGASGSHYDQNWGTVNLNNCTVSGNSAKYGGGVNAGELNNCTVTGNSATEAYGIGGTSDCTLNNCIVYFNTATNGANNYDYDDPWNVLNFCCTTPMPTNGVGNITNAPLYIDQASGNLRLQPDSPCINAGRYSAASNGPDLDGNPRIVGGTVDIGAYEFQSPQSILSYAWLQQNGLPIDGSADFADPDGDGHNNSQEWRAWTDPTNSASALRLLVPGTGTNSILIQWQSVSGQTYFLERSTQLGLLQSFVSLDTNIVGQAVSTVFNDTSAVGAGPFFYRVGVKE